MGQPLNNISPVELVMATQEKTSDVQMVEPVEKAGHLANQEEHEMTPMQAVKAYPWTVVWSIFTIWVLILASFDNQAGGQILSIPQFRKDFGFLYKGHYVLSAKWQSAFSGAPVASCIIGSLSSGFIADGIGRKLTYGIAMIFSIVGVTLEVIATKNAIFFAGKFINGFGIGGFISVSLTYIGEIAPAALRGIITSASAIAFTIGPLVCSLIINGIGAGTTRWSYRGVFVAQYGVLGIAALMWPFMPESPWWLLSKGREAKAAKSLRKLGYSKQETKSKMAFILLTLEEVRQETEGVTYLECFRKSNLRRTIISIAPLSIQALSGVYFAAAYATYYFQLAGYSTSDSFKLLISQNVLSLVGNVASWFIIDRVGRRSIMIYGLAFVTLPLILEGVLAVVGTSSALKGVTAMILIYGFFYNMTIGAAAYTILTETSTSRLRVKTIATGIALQNSIYTMWAFVVPYLFNPNEANLGAKISFIFAALAIICLVYLWFYQPETAGRTYEEMDEMFMKKIPARKFKGTITKAELMGRQAQELQSEGKL